jgi:CheY-like chemotaxis protein
MSLLSQSLKGRKRILLIEDEPLVGRTLKNLLRKEGLEAVVAPVGLAAMDFAANGAFDLIIADIRMPGMDGLKTLKAIRALYCEFDKPPVPEIILTAYDDPEVRQEAERMGIREFMLKPFESADFLNLLRRHLAADECGRHRHSRKVKSR